ISYSKADHALALKPSAFLEAEGRSVWWDKSLGAADLYRDEIMKQLVAARAVITIWTENSIKSDWVRAEAGAAKKEGKLIPVKTADVVYADVPLPFGEMHTENIASTELIRAAVVAQLAKPAVEPTAVALLAKGFKYEVLTWVGIVGGALTLFTNLSAVLKVADWARVLVDHWKEWTHAFWVWALGWLGIHLPPQWTPALSFLLFGSLLTIGQAFQFKRDIKDQADIDKYQGEGSFRLNLRRLSVYFLVALVAPMAVLALSHAVGITSVIPGEVQFSMNFLPPLLLIVLWSRERLHAALSVGLILMFFMTIAMVQFANIDFTHINITPIFVSLVLMCLLPLILLSVVPAKAISRRLIFLALGLLLLIALNELSKLVLDVTAPKLQG